MNLLENCEGKELPIALKWLNEPEDWSFKDNRLYFEVASSLDFFRDPKKSFNKESAPFLYTLVDGDFSITARVDAEMKAEYDSACLMIMSDNQNWAKLCFELVYEVPSIVSVVTRDTSDDCLSEKVGKIKPFLKIQRSGNCVAFHHSVDGKTWTMSRYFEMDLKDQLKVGLLGQCPLGDGCKVQIDRIELTKGSIEDVRVLI